MLHRTEHAVVEHLLTKPPHVGEDRVLSDRGGPTPDGQLTPNLYPRERPRGRGVPARLPCA
jgi:hypothetical protein